ncbi:hypothetical protein [Isoptericola croceus]|uniref:hypothetical protein n=1 Tax=Isoptericola croceus TaxID=3031406 RepID=UPI0023F8E285|nr:hypothetical protein [Isoptericola croceus]
MAATFHRTEEFTLLHRSGYLAGPVGDEDAGRVHGWEYRGDRWSANRPADGDPPEQITVACSVCSEPIAFRVRSVAATRTLRAALRWGAAASAVVAVLAIVLTGTAVGIADEAARSAEEQEAVFMVALGVVLVAASLTTAWTLALKAQAQVGVSGGGAGAATLAKHVVGRVGD